MTRRVLGTITLLFAAGAGSMKADIAYMAAGGDFGTIDLRTGEFSLLGNLPLFFVGLGVADGTLYGASFTGPGTTLYTVNTANGSLSVVGTSPVDYFSFGSTLTGLYALADSNGAGSITDLYSINPSTGAASPIGATGIVNAFWFGLSTNASTLYLSDDLNLYTLSTTTGAATLVGSDGGGSPLGIGPMLWQNGTLWAGQEAPQSRIDTIDPTSGAASQGPSTFGYGGGFNGLAPDPLPEGVSVQPEPSFLPVLAPIVIALVYWRFCRTPSSS